ncbi:MAG TPA: condensation domain-containing protein, partial [Thermoanaerobaculia bacterium]|nr:condensation domain-containing protein [Thermoanaerobaculia bacterium]
ASFDAAALALGQARPAAPGAAARELASCGGSWLEQELAIVDPGTRRKLPAGGLGEIWIAGPNVAAGYWDRPEESAETFGAYAEDGSGPYLRTGDLGFLAEGELFIAGRSKDLIILRGRNLYPQDLELTAEGAHAALRPGSGAAFSVEKDGEERLVLVCELERSANATVRNEGAEGIAAAVRAAIAEEHEAQLADLVLVKVGGVPKTSSGKVQRHACRDAYLAGTLPVVARSAAGEGADPGEEAAGDLESLLRSLAARALGCPPERIAADQPLAAYGLDSLAALELRTAVEERLGAALPLATLFEGATLADLAALLTAELEPGGAAPAPSPAVPAAAGTGDLPLSYGQEGLWAQERLASGAGVYNIAGAFRIEAPEEGLDPERLGAALREIAARHPALRLRISAVDGQPRQRVAAEPAFDFVAVDSREWTAGAVRRHLAAEAYRPFDLENGPLARVRLLRGTPGGDVALFAFHHTVVDFGSVATIARDLAALWGGPRPEAAAESGPYEEYVRWQRERLAGPEGERLRAFWRERLEGLPDLDLPTDRPRPPVPSFRGLAAGAALPPAVAERLETLARELGTTLQAVLLAGWSAWLHRVSGQDGFAVGVPTHGRSRSRFAETVGYFVNPVAVRARTQGDPGFRELLERTRDELFGALEHADDPFPRLAAELRPVRDPARSPLFQTIFVHHAGRGLAGAVAAAA